MTKLRLDKALSHAAGVPRKRSRILVRQGRVTVNGVVHRDSSVLIDDNDTLTFDGEVVGDRVDVAVFHKPVGVQCTVGDPLGRMSLSDVANDLLAEGLHPVGRLDADTSGLLLFVRDGQLTQRLLHPRHAVNKTYRATVEGAPGQPLVDALAAGVETAHGVHTAVVESIEGSAVTLTVTEGKHRMVRRMLNNAGFPVLTLRRTQMGAVTLGDLAPETWREPSEAEAEWLFALLDPEA